jgi:hypothetical protein
VRERSSISMRPPPLHAVLPQYWHDPLSPECRRILTILLASEY